MPKKTSLVSRKKWQSKQIGEIEKRYESEKPSFSHQHLSINMTKDAK